MTHRAAPDQRSNKKMPWSALYCLWLGTAAAADLTVFYPVSHKDANYAKIEPRQWDIASSGLTVAEPLRFENADRVCRVSFLILAPLVQGRQRQGKVLNLPGYLAVRTSPGRWRIEPPPGTPAHTFRIALTAYAIANQIAEPNPGYTGPSHSRCLTPEASN
ncbi:hypothetical protein [Chitinimonas lacunae]|uniref:Uncharacterized protein n=1 Tax=Chitinimonas lacunae TaxID=1963018 RepID=A0ABV8MP62_9NEIS